MADDNFVEIRFGAVTDEAIAGIDRVRKALSGLTEPGKKIEEKLALLKAAFGDMLQETTFSKYVDDFAKIGDAGKRSAEEINAEIKLLHLGLAEEKAMLAAAAGQFQITQEQKEAMLRAAADKEYQEELALLKRKAELTTLSTKQELGALLQLAEFKTKHRIEEIKRDEEAIAQYQRMWMSALKSVESAFNSQLRGLLAGTTSWSQAFKHILGDLIIKFIEFGEEILAKWLSIELAKTTASVAGARTRAAAEDTSLSGMIAAHIADALKSIFSSAGKTSAEVAAAVAPVAGPAAPAIGAAAGASVVAQATSLAGFDLGTDYVLRSGLAFIHQGEAVVPPLARGSGPFTGASLGPRVHAPISINIAALDAQSVARFFDDNARHLIRAIQRGMARGAHVGLRGAR